MKQKKKEYGNKNENESGNDNEDPAFICEVDSINLILKLLKPILFAKKREEQVMSLNYFFFCFLFFFYTQKINKNKT